MPVHITIPQMSNDRERRGFWMRMAREWKGLSQESAAQALGIKASSKSTLSKLEKGQLEPSASLVARMAEIYGVPVELLMHPPASAEEVIERRLAALVRAAAELEREDWAREEGADQGTAPEPPDEPRTR